MAKITQKISTGEQEKLIEEQEKESEADENSSSYKVLTHCPYCRGKVTKKRLRNKKHEQVQVQRYYCKNCNKRFTSLITKYKTYPLKVIMDALTLYNRLNYLEKIPV